MEITRGPAVAGDSAACADTPSTEEPAPAGPAPARQLCGAAICGGFAAGRARYVDTAADAAELGPEEVAVCRALTPALAVNLGRAAAVIAEAGGPLGTGATLLRERGVPAVVAPGARSHLRAGQRVVVDGTRGTVWIGARLAPIGDDLG